MTRNGCVPVACAALLSIAACDRPGATPSIGNETLPFAVEVEDGPVKATVARSGDAMDVADLLIVELVAEGPASLDATLPSDMALAPFEVVSRTPPQRLALSGDRVATSARLTLTSDRAGDLELPALGFTFTPAPTTADGTVVDGPAPTVITTPAVPIAVASLLDGDADPEKIIGNKPAATRPGDGGRWRLVLIASSAVLVIAATTTAVVMARRRRRVPPPTPVEWATLELDRLSAEGLAARGDVEPFFVRLTGVAREFIRRQLGIAAPARTSDEFLRDLGNDPRFAPSQQALLARLLRFGDMVKFAREAADEKACAEATSAVRQLIDELGGEELGIRSQESGTPSDDEGAPKMSTPAPKPRTSANGPPGSPTPNS